MLANLDISEAEIEFAEKILLPPDQRFDAERRAFIRDLSTLDLQAVPGSGKTTALLAKLLVLEKHLPFSSGRGILVLSHTNAAIDEIKDRIGGHCKHLFSYPNFVGTIQNFVNDFLAIPYFQNRTGRDLTHIDNDLYVSRYLRFNEQTLSGFNTDDTRRARHFLNFKETIAYWRLRDGEPVLVDSAGADIVVSKPKPKPSSGSKQPYADWSPSEKASVLRWISSYKTRILREGYCSFDEAYYLAGRYLKLYPAIAQILRSRFAFCFVDEMQDMSQQQYELLESVFYNQGCSETVYQRIGDRNQAIYLREAGHSYWVDRTTVLTINGSHRLTKSVADIVQKLALSPIQITGLSTCGRGADIQPILLTYRDETIQNVIPTYASLISDLIESGDIPRSPNNKYYTIGWTTQSTEGKTRLDKYYPNYNKGMTKAQPRSPSLFSQFSALSLPAESLGDLEHSVTSAILRVLREEGVVDKNSRAFTKATLTETLREADPCFLEEYRSQIYEICALIANHEISAACAAFTDYIQRLLTHWNKSVQLTTHFLTDASSAAPVCAPSVQDPSNQFHSSGISIDIATVHSVKGETHTATLYVETFYQKSDGGGNYESERLADQLCGMPFEKNVHDFKAQSARMAYVGFSRPTHLLCFAVHESRAAKLLLQTSWKHSTVD